MRFDFIATAEEIKKLLIRKIPDPDYMMAGLSPLISSRDTARAKLYEEVTVNCQLSLDREKGKKGKGGKGQT